MKICRAKTVAFSGHRTCKMSGGLLPFDGGGHVENLSERLENAIQTLCEEGFDTFLCGMAEGFDLQAAEAVIRVRKRLPDPVYLIAVIPHRGQAQRFPYPVREVYESVLACADDSITLSESYSTGCFHARNDYLVDHSAVLLCYYNGSKGGTQYTVRRALRSGLRIVNTA